MSDKVEKVEKASPSSGGTSSIRRSKPETGSAIRGASLLIILQIASRAVTFVANQLLLRFLTAQLLGVSTQLEVYYLSVLFFARESLRVAIQRQGNLPSSTASDGEDASASAQRNSSQLVVNIAHLPLLLGLAASLAFGWAYIRYVDELTANTPHLHTSVRLYGLAALVELLSEPAFVVLQHRLRFGPRAAAESIGTFLRCLVTFGAANWAWRRGFEVGVLPFALGQLAYGCGLLVVYTWYGYRLASSEGFTLFPKRTSISTITDLRTAGEKEEKSEADDAYVLGLFYKPTLQLASSLTSQSFVKHILTQGDTFLVSILSDPGSQGIYALANNYGSLLARLVFQPIEESSRNYFSKLLSSASSSSSSSSSHTNSGRKEEGKEGKTPQQSTERYQALDRAAMDLQALLKFYLLLSTIILSIGPFAAPLAVQVVAGARWSASGAGRVLAHYCLYVPLLAVNGITEAFVSSVATERELHRQSLWMTAFSLAFAAAGFVTLRVLELGAGGLVYANGMNMLCRIVWSTSFIRTYFGRNGVRFSWTGVLPDGWKLYVVCTAILQAILIQAGISIGSVSTHVLKDLFTVASAAVPFVGVIAYTERRYLLDCYHSIRGSRGTP